MRTGDEASCVFCAIIAGASPGRIVYEDDQAVAVEDIRPQAPTHLLVLPRRHFRNLAELEAHEEGLVGHLLMVAAELASRRGLRDRGYRLVLNTGRDAGQSIPHLHLHLFGGRRMTWPPG